MAIPGIDTGGGGLSNQNSSSAANQGGDFLGGNKNFSFAGPEYIKGIDTNTLALYAAGVAVAWLIFKGVKRG